MSDVAVSGYDETIDAEFVTVSKLNKAGVNVKDVIWLDIPEDEVYGWYFYDEEQDEMIDMNDDPLTVGDCLVITAQKQASGWKFVSSGEVDFEGVAVTLAQGTQYLANAVPRDATFGEVSVDGYGTEVIDAEYVTASKLDKAGVNVKDVIWLDIPEDEVYGWYFYDEEQDEMIDSNEDELLAGEGIVVTAQTKAAGWSIIFPAAIPVAK